MSAHVFLSAGIPDRPERGAYVETADPVAIRDAVRALASVVVDAGFLVFGGHPAITPLVWQVGAAMARTDRVLIYQSEEFRDLVPPEALGFENLRWTAAGADQGESLSIMRAEMISGHPHAAGVFVGGMDGVEDEHAMFAAAHPGAIRLPVASTGGAAGGLWEREAHAALPAGLWDRLRHDLSYRGLFAEALAPALA